MPTNTMPARELILAALTQASAPLTVTDLAEEAGVGKSTVSKYLPALEKEGLAVRAPGGRQGRRRLPDHWQAAATTPTEPIPPAQEATSCTAENPAEAEVVTSASVMPAHKQVTPVETDAPAQETSVEDSAPSPEDPDTGQVPVPDPDTGPAATTQELATAARVPAAASPTSAVSAQRESRTGTGAGEEGVNPVSGSRRLEPGELKLMVWALLKADPGQEFTATELSHTLQGRSIGAIQNNLAKLTKEGKAELAYDKPRRYRFAQQTP